MATRRALALILSAAATTSAASDHPLVGVWRCDEIAASSTMKPEDMILDYRADGVLVLDQTQRGVLEGRWRVVAIGGEAPRIRSELGDREARVDRLEIEGERATLSDGRSTLRLVRTDGSTIAASRAARAEARRVAAAMLVGDVPDAPVAGSVAQAPWSMTAAALGRLQPADAWRVELIADGGAASPTVTVSVPKAVGRVAFDPDLDVSIVLAKGEVVPARVGWLEVLAIADGRVECALLAASDAGDRVAGRFSFAID